MLTNLIILIILLILSAFFSATEVAFISLTDAKVSTMVKRRLPKAKLIRKLKSRPRRLLVAILIGNNVVNIAAASLATIVASDIFDSAVLGITTGVMTLLVLIFGEIIPKSYAANYPKKFAIFSAPILYAVQTVTLPAVVVFEVLTNLFAGKQKLEKVSEDELSAMVTAGKKQGTIEKDEAFMIHRLFKMNDINAEDIMTPRVQVESISDDISIEEAASMILKENHTRFPVSHDTIDNIVGLIHSRDILVAYNKDKESTAINKIIRPILKVPKQMLIDDLLREFQKKKTHMAVVLDEYGGTEGIVTLEDVLEELVGEIVDEHDVEDNIIKRVGKNIILASGDEQIRDINDFFNINLPGNPLDTIAEIILDEVKKAPRKNMEVEFENITCTVTEVKDEAITKVKVVKK